jgi:futalosine hydrolase
MKILIVSATSLEIPEVLERLGEMEPEGQKLRKGELGRLEVHVLVPGVGMVATAYWMGKYLEKYQYDLTINLGIAGSFQDDIPLGSVVHVDRDGFPEMGAEDGEQFLSLLDLDLLEDDDFPFTQGVIHNSHSHALKTLDALPSFSSITVNTVHGEEDSIARIRKSWNPSLESMEGASFFYAALIERIPCIQIRAISNRVEARDRSRWNIPLAVKNLNTFALEMLEELNARN